MGEEYGDIPFDEEAIMSEIFARGPVACAIYSGPLEAVKTGFKGVFHTTETGETDHAISLVGYGVDEETGMKYWVLRNSWGEYFADGGFIKVQRGVNMINIEDSCFFANPVDTWSKQVYPNDGSSESGKTKNLNSLGEALRMAHEKEE